MKKTIKLSALLMIAVLFMSVAVFSADAANKLPKATIQMSDVNLRSGAGLSYSIVGNLTKSEKVTLLDGRVFNKSWYYIKDPYGTKGYVHKDYVKINSNQLYIADKKTGYTGYTANFTNFVNTTSDIPTWSSSNHSVASYNSGGKLVCHKAGTTTITVTAGKKTVSSTLTVKDATVTLDKDIIEMYNDDDPVKLKAQCVKAVTFTSTKPAVAEVSDKGVVKPKAAGTTKIKAASASGSAVCTVTVKKRVITLKTVKSAMYTGNYDIITPSGGKHKYTYASSNTNIVTVDSKGLVYATGTGTAKVTVTSGTLTKTKTYKVKSGSFVNMSNLKGTVRENMTLYIKSTTAGVTWSTSDKKIATVKNGFVLGKKKGTAIITASISGGARDCLVTVNAAEPVRFAYTSQNSVLKGKSVKLYAITDTARTDVKFKLISASGKTKAIKNPTKTESSGRITWCAETTPTEAGVYTLKAYAHTAKNTKWSSTDGGETTFIVNSYTDRAATTFGQKRVTTALLKNIAGFEGFLSKVTDDQLVADTPTVGYGHVVYAGTTFYNGMTKKEAFAFLSKDVNQSGYTSRVNNILKSNNIKFNQAHFDALVDFSYNLGSYAIENDEDLVKVLTKTYGKDSYKLKAYVRMTSTELRETASDSSRSLKTLAPFATVTMCSTKVYNKSWYKVKTTDSKVGYVKKSHVVRRSPDTSVRNLKNINYNSLKSNILPYHHASGSCYWGLLYRRIDEVEMFCFRNYAVDGVNNNYKMKYYCSRNTAFGVG